MHPDPVVTWGLIALTVLVSWRAFNDQRLFERLILWPPAISRQRQYERLLTHGFIHADGMHLLFNMVTLYFFGSAIERAFSPYIGQAGFLLFYLSAIVIAIMPTWLRHQHDPHYRSLGASGGVAAVLFAMILISPWSMIMVFFIPMPAVLFGLVYLGYSIWMDRRGGDNINHSAHLWGAGYGMVFTVLMEPQVAADFIARVVAF